MTCGELLGDSARDETRDLGDGAWIRLIDGFVLEHEARMEALVAEIPLRQETLTIAQQTWPTPRLTSWHGDVGVTYTYSRRTFLPAPWTPGLVVVRDALEAAVGARFNGCLANYYRGGDDAMGAHSDDEPELGPNAPDDVLIASVSLGARRRFVLARKRGERERIVLELGLGDLLVMGGATQRDFRHHVPRTKRPVGPRLNLTFRIVRLSAHSVNMCLRA